MRAFLVAAALALGTPAVAQDVRPALTVAVQDVPRALDPLSSVSNVDWRGHANMFDGLLTMDFAGDSRPLPALAQSWRRVDDRTLQLTLRENVLFHDGSLLTAADVAFSFGADRMRGERALGFATGRIFFATIAAVEAVDARTVRVITSQPDPLLEQRLGVVSAGIVSERAFRAAPDGATWNRTAVGTGPYRVRSFRLGTDLVMEAHDAWWGGRPPVRSVRLWAVPEVAGRIAALRSDEVQIATDIPTDQFSTIAADQRLEVVGSPAANLRVLMFNSNHPALRDPRVRRAIGLAIDREQIVRTLWDGRVPVARSHQLPSFRELYLSDWPMPAFDPGLARQLLREAGYRGERLEFWTYGNYYANEHVTSQALLEMWRAVGLNVELLVRETSTPLNNAAASPRAIRNWSNSMALPDPAGGLWRLYGARGPVQTSLGEWRNDEFNRLGAVLESSTDISTRQAAWRRMLEIYDRDDPPGTVLHPLALFYGKRRDVSWRPLPVEWTDFRPAQFGAGS